MTLFRYSLVRCVPEPRTGEFINVGAIAGSEDAGDWQVRQISNMRRAARLCTSDQLTSALAFLASASSRIEDAEDQDEPLSDAWLVELHGSMRNVVQLSDPQVAVGVSATEVLDTVFDRMLIDPERQSRGYTGKHALLASLRRAYRAQANAQWHVFEKPEVHVGGHLRTPLDFAFASDKAAVQISQAWSFQKGSIRDVATEVKSWGYAMGRLRDGESARVITSDGNVIQLDSDVPIEILAAPPESPQQQEVFEEAGEVFSEVGAHLNMEADADAIGNRAKVLIGA